MTLLRVAPILVTRSLKRAPHHRDAGDRLLFLSDQIDDDLGV